MSNILENIMNFINENTTLLIIICVFLILVLIGYLIDNSIKTKKLAKLEAIKKTTVEEPSVANTVVEEPTVETTVPQEPVKPVAVEPVVVEPVKEEVKVEEPVVSSVEIPDINLEEEVPEVKVEPVSEEKSPTIEVPVVPIDLPKVEDVSKPEEVKANEFTIDPKINELLSRDFTKENTAIPADEEIKAKSVEIPSVEEKEEVPTVKVTEIKVEEPVKKEEKSKYKNSKSLSEILGKKEPKKETANTDPDLMSTVDFQHELDRLLDKLNKEIEAEDNSNDSTVEETQDFTNMF